MPVALSVELHRCMTVRQAFDMRQTLVAVMGWGGSVGIVLGCALLLFCNVSLVALLRYRCRGGDHAMLRQNQSWWRRRFRVSRCWP